MYRYLENVSIQDPGARTVGRGDTLQRAWTLGKLDDSHLHRPKSSSGVMPNTATAGILHRELDTEDLQVTGEPEQSHRPRSLNASTG
ncbi:hypothetical protein HBI92_031650 [Parastagonospora nodorum]|nr:hypothetical protein HBI48_088000 [Parastagonospora nodorum]KAH5484051.1 hypothetical protein HBI31_171230 [Parastagonospora nodorum]KAH5905209.1 hypothetical protein HBI92_031650 [Parastagonospora nodorum]